VFDPGAESRTARAPSVRAVVGLVGMRSRSARSAAVTSVAEPTKRAGCALVVRRLSFIALRIRLVSLGIVVALSEAHG